MQNFWAAVSRDEGSAEVEAAMIFPIIILIVALIIRSALGIYENVKADSLRHTEEVNELLSVNILAPENIMRSEKVLRHE